MGAQTACVSRAPPSTYREGNHRCKRTWGFWSALWGVCQAFPWWSLMLCKGRHKSASMLRQRVGTKTTHMKIPSSQVSHWVTVQLVGETPETSATSLPYWSMVGAGLASTEPAARVKTSVSPTCSAYHWRGRETWSAGGCCHWTMCVGVCG